MKVLDGIATVIKVVLALSFCVGTILCAVAWAIFPAVFVLWVCWSAL